MNLQDERSQIAELEAENARLRALLDEVRLAAVAVTAKLLAVPEAPAGAARHLTLLKGA